MKLKYKNNSRVDEIVASLMNICRLLGDTVPTDRLFALAEVLNSEIPDDENMILAMDMVVLRETRLPSPSKFMEYAGASVRAKAQDALEKIFKAIKTYGSDDPSNARRFLGEAAWRTMESCGGWRHICMMGHDQLNTYRSQFIHSYVDRVPFMEASGEVRREFLPASPETKALIEKTKSAMDQNNPFVRKLTGGNL